MGTRAVAAAALVADASKPRKRPSAVRKQVWVASVERFAMAASLTTAGRVVSRTALRNLRMRASAAGRLRAVYFRRGPGIREARAVVVADDGIAFTLGSAPAAAAGVRLGKCHASRKVKSAWAPGPSRATGTATPLCLGPAPPVPARHRHRNRPRTAAGWPPLGRGQPVRWVTRTRRCRARVAPASRRPDRPPPASGW